MDRPDIMTMLARLENAWFRRMETRLESYKADQAVLAAKEKALAAGAAVSEAVDKVFAARNALCAALSPSADHAVSQQSSGIVVAEHDAMTVL